MGWIIGIAIVVGIMILFCIGRAKLNYNYRFDEHGYDREIEQDIIDFIAWRDRNGGK